MGAKNILIAGAGPVGLTLACECLRHGVDFRIIDRNPEPSTRSKALALWSGNIECLSAMGVAEDFLAKSMPLHHLVFADNGRQLGEICINAGVDSPYPNPFVLPQSRTEQILLEHLGERGVRVERPVELVDFTETPEGVEAVLRHADGTQEKAIFGWLAGCDGARSIVRHKLPVEFPGETEPQGFVLIDAEIDGELPDDAMFANWGDDHTTAFFPVTPGVFRMFTQRKDTSDRSDPTLAEMQGYLDTAGLSRIRFRDPKWLAYFAINERVTTRMRVGRIFLLGDAAHIHSPAGGQGMNTGMQDAFNLGWKLACLASGEGDAEAIAESFQAERHPVAVELIEKTSKLLHAGISQNPLIRLAKDLAISLLFQAEALQKKISGELSELHIHYPSSPLLADDAHWSSHKHGIGPGMRARDVALAWPATMEPVSLWPQLIHPGFTLLLFSGRTPDVDVLSSFLALTEIIRPHEGIRAVAIWHGSELPERLPCPVWLDQDGVAHKKYGANNAAWVLVRPDQYVAARAQPADAEPLEEFLARVV